MTPRAKTVLSYFVMLAVCSPGAVWLGGIWYSSWWDVSWVPMPPFCRFVLPHGVVGYDFVHDEMVLWSFMACATLLLLVRHLWLRTQNQVTGANAGGPRRLPIRTLWAARIAQFWRWAAIDQLP